MRNMREIPWLQRRSSWNQISSLKEAQKCIVFSGWFPCYLFPNPWIQHCFIIMPCSWFYIWQGSSWRENPARYAASFSLLLCSLSVITVWGTASSGGVQRRSVGRQSVQVWGYEEMFQHFKTGETIHLSYAEFCLVLQMLKTSLFSAW